MFFSKTAPRPVRDASIATTLVHHNVGQGTPEVRKSVVRRLRRAETESYVIETRLAR